MAAGRPRFLVLGVALLALAGGVRASDPPFPAAVQGLLDAPPRWLGPPGARVDVGPTGLIVAAEGVRALAPPAGGPTSLSPSSSPAWLAGDVDEWAAISFMEGRELRTGAIGSRGPDWAGRGEIKPLQFVADARGAVATGRLRDLKVKTELGVYPDVPGVMVTVILTNRAPGPITDLTYAREWRQPDGRIARAQWSLGTLARRQAVGLTFWYVPAGVTPPGGGQESLSALDLPVTLWVHPDHPYGLEVGATNGLSWGDYDADGWPDLFACESGNLWRNEAGAAWTLATNLLPILPKATIRYGASFGDYDADGWPDLVTEPRKVISGDTCLHLLHNDQGTATFTDVSATALDVQPCLADGETACWADVDGDGRLDLFLPAYPPWVLNGTGNWLFHNLGPASQPMFEEVSTPAEIEVPLNNARPEGAQFCDVDGDGDPDLYSNGTLYLNDSTPGTPHFVPLPATSSGIPYPGIMDEGAAFFDYDLDGDFDLFVAYADAAYGAKLFENQGDGSFVEGEPGIIDAPMLGVGLGLSAEDWDGDGDIDFSTRQVFRRNELLETGTRWFKLGLTPIPSAYVFSATPAWADWDKDGDLDMALGNYLLAGSFWTNTTLTASADRSARRDVQVLVLDDAPGAPGGGTQTAYGASVALHVQGDGLSPGGGMLARRKFSASSAGYLNQSDYPLSFFLPPDPAPRDPDVDLLFDVTVDFPGAPGFAPGGVGGTLHRIDRHVNPALGGIALATLADRELRVFRSGKVIIDGQVFQPAANQPLDLATTTGGLQLPSANAGVGRLEPALTINRWIGLEADTSSATQPVHVRELLVDGRLDDVETCAAPPFNVAVWDVTSASQPVLLPNGTAAAVSSVRNNRSFVPVDFTLQRGRRYRVVVRVTSTRFTDAAPSAATEALAVTGSLDFKDDSPCDGNAVAHAPLDDTRAYIALRWGEETPHTVWTDLGGALAGSAGTPLLTGEGELSGGQSITFTLSSTPRFAPVWMILGTAVANQPFKGGTLVPEPLFVAGGLATDASGGLQIVAPIASDLPSGLLVVLQAWLKDVGGVQGAAASNGVSGVAP
ncbi:MAG TPA: VCBS repeat-containing protein [Planctomycetota bacterium]|nr:VCBS repeat-containing protein [Planctomycetota bacterium]